MCILFLFYNKYVDMKKLYWIFLFCGMICLIGLSSCHDNNKSRENINEFVSQLTAQDSTTVLALGDSCMNYFKSKNVDSALGMLYVEQDGQLTHISDSMKTIITKRFKIFPVLDYKLDYYTFLSESVNDLKYRIVFGEATEDMPEQTTGFMFNPIKSNGVWYLTLKMSNTGVVGQTMSHTNQEK